MHFPQMFLYERRNLRSSHIVEAYVQRLPFFFPRPMPEPHAAPRV
jgi:hypothetical protein